MTQPSRNPSESDMDAEFRAEMALEASASVCSVPSLRHATREFDASPCTPTAPEQLMEHQKQYPKRPDNWKWLHPAHARVTHVAPFERQRRGMGIRHHGHCRNTCTHLSAGKCDVAHLEGLLDAMSACENATSQLATTQLTPARQRHRASETDSTFPQATITSYMISALALRCERDVSDGSAVDRRCMSQDCEPCHKC